VSAAPPPAAPVPTEARAPVFVIGYVRSGTTLLRRMLDAHPELFVLQELDEFQRLPPRLGRRGLPDRAALEAFLAALPPFYLRRIYDPERFRALAAPRLPLATPEVFRLLKASARAAAAKPGARWGHKEPHEWPFVYRLRVWFPDAQFLHIVRRPHDVAASVAHYREVKLHSKPTTTVISAWHWRESVRSVTAEAARLGPGRYLRLRYEDLAARPEATLARIAHFLGIDPGGVAHMLRFHEQPLEGHAGRHMSRVREPVSHDRESRAERSLSGRRRRDIDWICRREMAELGYAPLGAGPPGRLRRAGLDLLCAGLWLAWRGLRATRRLRGRL